MELVLGSDSEFLRLEDTDGRLSLRRSSDGALDYVYVTLQLSALSAMTRVSLVAGVDLPLSTFFEELAGNWRGWNGARTWAAYEGGLEFSCTHDGLGHVALAVALQQGSGIGWLVRGEVPLEAGQLEEVAHAARRFEAGP